MLFATALLAFHLASVADLQDPTDYASYCRAPDGSRSKGKLRIYGSATEIGTIAIREFRDESGHISMEIFYSLSRGSEARKHWPPRPDDIAPADLVVQSVGCRAYDEGGRMIREESFRPDGTLARSTAYEYDGAGQKARIRTNWGGLRTYDTRISKARETTRLFDGRDRLITLAGDVAPGEAPPGGWGLQSGGVAVHLAVSPRRGRPKQIRVALTALDSTRRKASTYVGGFPYLELRDSADRPVAPTAYYLARLHQYRPRLSASAGPCETRAWLAEPPAVWEMDFVDVFGEVPPGEYTMRAGACLDGGGAIYGPLTLTILGGEQR